MNTLVIPASPLTGPPRLTRTRHCWNGLLALFAGVALNASATPLGNGRLSSVTAVDDGCVHDTINNANSVEAWDVQQGKTYHVTLKGVTECSSDTIGVIV